MPFMVERIRLVTDTDEEIRLAVKLAAAREGVSASELVNRILRRYLSAEIRDAKKYARRPEPPPEDDQTDSGDGPPAA